MKRRITAIASALSAIALGQPLIIGTGAALTTAGVILTVPGKALSESADFYYERANDEKYKEAMMTGDYSGVISDHDKAIEIEPKIKYYNSRANFKMITKDMKGACEDWASAGSLGLSLGLGSGDLTSPDEYQYQIAFGSWNSNCQ